MKLENLIKITTGIILFFNIPSVISFSNLITNHGLSLESFVGRQSTLNINLAVGSALFIISIGILANNKFSLYLLFPFAGYEVVYDLNYISNISSTNPFSWISLILYSLALIIAYIQIKNNLKTKKEQ